VKVSLKNLFLGKKRFFGGYLIGLSRKVGLSSFERVECADDADWIGSNTVMIEVDGIRRMTHG